MVKGNNIGVSLKKNSLNYYLLSSYFIFVVFHICVRRYIHDLIVIFFLKTIVIITYKNITTIFFISECVVHAHRCYSFCVDKTQYCS